jgi:uncharacterized membrane protein HdeD (DUF308 family)
LDELKEREMTMFTLDRAESELKLGRGTLITLGVINMVLGVVAMGSPWVAGTAVTMLLGGVLMVSGIFELLHAFGAGGRASGIFGFLGGLLALLGGAVILARPVLGLAMLTLVLAIGLIMDGVARAVCAFRARSMSGRGWLLFGGMVSFLLGVSLWRHWPLSGLWAVGVLVGARILMTGWTMLVLGVLIGRRPISDAE